MTALLANQFVSFLKWDTDYFGFPIAQIKEHRVDSNSLNQAFEYCEDNCIKLLQFKCDAHHSESIKLAESHGFHFVDIRMTYEVCPELKFEVEAFDDCRIASSKDISKLVELADGIFDTSRYYFDKNFPKEKVNIFYQDWVRKAVEGVFDDYLVVLERDRKIAGFCSVKELNKNTACIGILGVDKKLKGNGIGKTLVDWTISNCFEKGIKKLDVVTQGRNYSAQRLYQRCGFVIENLELYYHKWF